MKIEQLSIGEWGILLANDYFYSDVEPVSKYSLVMFHL